MPIHVTCFACKYETNVPDSAAGMKGKCPKCGTVVHVPKLASDADVVEAEVVEGPPPVPNDDFDPIQLEGLSQGAVVASPIKAPAPDDRRPCPVCGEMISKGAMKCRFCNEIFDPALKKREARKNKPSFVGGDGDDLSAGEWLVAILCSGIGCIIGIVWMVMGKPKGKKMFLVSLCVSIVLSLVRVALESNARR